MLRRISARLLRLDRNDASACHCEERSDEAISAKVTSAESGPEEIVRGCAMAFSLIDDDAGAVPVEIVPKAGFSRGARPRRGASATGRRRSGSPEKAGKLALVPGRRRAARPRAGRHRRRRGGDVGRCRLPGIAAARRLSPRRVPHAPKGADPSRLALGWALGTYSFDLYRKKKKDGAARLVWPRGPIAALSSGSPARCAWPAT